MMADEAGKKSASGKGIFPSKYAFTLLIPFRKFILSPKKLIEQIQPGKDSRILEVGPGPGFFSADVARSITDGKLTLFDIQQEMLDKARKRLEKRNISNVEFVKSDGSTFSFPDDHFDIIFMVTVLGEVEEKETYLKEFGRILKKGGIIAISEQKGDPDLMSKEEVTELFLTHGFEPIRDYGNSLYFTMIFGRSS